MRFDVRIAQIKSTDHHWPTPVEAKSDCNNRNGQVAECHEQLLTGVGQIHKTPCNAAEHTQDEPVSPAKTFLYTANLDAGCVVARHQVDP